MMNERIRQLAEQAGIYKLNLSDETEYWIMEKFAELIVQQCADIGERYADGNYEVRNQILEHFGLEEE
jgi:uncharacterized protein YutE (UPF0331/DUF86 family)